MARVTNNIAGKRRAISLAQPHLGLWGSEGRNQTITASASMRAPGNQVVPPVKGSRSITCCTRSANRQRAGDPLGPIAVPGYPPIDQPA
jgi:hypothetical protein